MLKDPSMPKTAPNWTLMAKSKPGSSEKEARYILMREELIKANFGKRQQINRWREDEVLITYRKLLKFREENPERYPSPVKETIIIAPRPTRKSSQPVRYNPQKWFFYNPRLYDEYVKNLKKETGCINWMKQCTETEKVMMLKPCLLIPTSIKLIEI